MDRDFLLIPVLVEPVDDAKLRASRLEPTQIQEVQSIISGDEEQILRQVSARLLEVDEAPTPLDIITDYLTYELEKVPVFALNKAARHFKLDPGPWAPGNDLRLLLAQKMLAEGLQGASKALRDIRSYLQPPREEALNGIINAVGSSWVDYHAVKTLQTPAPGKLGVGINGITPLIARLYVARASETPREPWEVAEVTGIAGENLDEALIREIFSTLKRLFEADSTEEVVSELKVRADQDIPVFVVLPGQGVSDNTMEKLKQAFNGVRFFLLTGEGEPPAAESLEKARIVLLEPLLQPGHEAYYCCQYQNARQLHLGDRPEDDDPYHCTTAAAPGNRSGNQSHGM
jgi:hypothetical protein